MTLDVAVVGAAAFGASLVSLFSGFGLGTLLMPVFALFFPVDVAIASTAVVHAANNLFKFGLLARGARREVVARFGVPAVVAAFAGAAVLTELAQSDALAPLATWQLGGRTAHITPLGLVVGLAIVAFSLADLVPGVARLEAPARWLPLGGALSGFFGGLSGHQGALRAIFLAPLGLAPAEFAATQAVIALLVDGARLAVYGVAFGATMRGDASIPWTNVAAATACAFAGAYLGKRLLPKTTVGALRALVGALLLVVGAALATGLA